MTSVFGEEDCTDLYDINVNNFQKIKNGAIKIGYTDGIHDGRESVYQNGFDQGFRDGLATSFNLEKYKWFFNSIRTSKVNDGLVKEKKEYETMECKPLEAIKTEHVKQTIKQFEQIIPVATSLLHVQTPIDL